MLKNYLWMAFYLCEKPGRLPNLLRINAISRTFIIKNEALKLAYIVNPKVASSSISYLLDEDFDVASLAGKNTPKKNALLHKHPLHSYDEIDRLREAGYFVFSFVRNPYSRLVSFYKKEFAQTGKGYLRPQYFAIRHQLRGLKYFHDVANVVCEPPIFWPTPTS